MLQDLVRLSCHPQPIFIQVLQQRHICRERLNTFGGMPSSENKTSAEQEIMQQPQEETVAAEEPEAEASDNSDQFADDKEKKGGEAGPAQATGSAGVSSSLTRELLEHMYTERNATRCARAAVDNIFDIAAWVRAQLEMPLEQRDEERTEDALHDVLRTISDWRQAMGESQKEEKRVAAMASPKDLHGPRDLSLSGKLHYQLSFHSRAQQGAKKHADWIYEAEAQLRAKFQEPEQHENHDESHDILETIAEWRGAMRLGLLPKQEMILNDLERRLGLPHD